MNLEKKTIIVKKEEKNLEDGRELINQYLRQQSLSSGKPNYNVAETEEYLTNKNSTSQFVSTEEIESEIKKINDSIDEIKEETTESQE
jgi:hypothetical protein